MRSPQTNFRPAYSGFAPLMAVGLCANPPADFLWKMLPHVLRMSRAKQVQLSEVFRLRAKQIEQADSECSAEILNLPEPERLSLARLIMHWWDMVSRISLAPDYSTREVILQLVPAASGDN